MNIEYLLDRRTTPFSAIDIRNGLDHIDLANKYDTFTYARGGGYLPPRYIGDYPGAGRGASFEHLYRRIFSLTGNSDAFYLKLGLWFGNSDSGFAFPYAFDKMSINNNYRISRQIALSGISGGTVTVEFMLGTHASVLDDTALWHESTVSDVAEDTVFLLTLPISFIRVVAAEGVSWTIEFSGTEPSIVYKNLGYNTTY